MDAHLKSADFLEVQRYPEIIFTSTKVERAGFSATTRIDRRDFGLTWSQVVESGGLVVGNEIRITLEVEATRTSA